MISFIWSPGHVLPAGKGGSENYTVGQVRELNRRGIAAQVVTVGLGTADGRADFPGVPFRALPTLAGVTDLQGTVVFVNEPHVVATRNPAYLILHNPPPIRERYRRFAVEGTAGRTLIATSAYAARLWAAYLEVPVDRIHVVYPFAEPCFAEQARPVRDRAPVRVLFAGRLSPEKGIYTLLSTMHVDVIADAVAAGALTVTVTTAGAYEPQGQVIEALLQAHPSITVVPARKSPAEMAALLAVHDVVVMPSNGQYWHETFGIVSIEAQHVGCRVVASHDGGLPETDCGGVEFVVADNAEALAWGITAAVESGPVSAVSRLVSTSSFTVARSVDRLLAVLAPEPTVTTREPVVSWSPLVGQL